MLKMCEKSFKFSFFTVVYWVFCLILLCQCEKPFPKKDVYLWKDAEANPFHSSDSQNFSIPFRERMTDPMISARAGGYGFQQPPQLPNLRKPQNLPTTVNTSLPLADEPPILNGVCSIPNLNPCVSNAKCITTVPIVGRATCACPPGYGGDGRKPELDGEGCINIDECRNGAHNCDNKSQECVDVQGSFYCKCKSGFVLSPSGKLCLDVDECQNPSLNTCNLSTSVCHNLEGSFRCQCKDSSMIVDPDTGICRDLDECNELSGSMNPCEQICINKDGGVACSCFPGYKLREDGKSCEDTNECDDYSLNQCDPNGVISKCVNTIGGYLCDCNNDLGYKTAQDGISCMNFNECQEYPYICGGALSCCKDLAPPQRFACSMPLDDNIFNPTDLSNALDAVSSPFTDTYSNSYKFMNTIPLALSNIPDVAGKVARGIATLPVTGGLQGFSAEQTSFNNSFTEDIINNIRKVGYAKTSKNIEKDNFVNAENNITYDAFDESKIINFLLETDLLEERKLQLLSGYRPRFIEAGSTLMRLPLVVNGNGLLDFRNILGLQALSGGGASGGIRIGRGTTCPYGFTLGGDLYRAKVRESAKQLIKSAVTSRMSSSGNEPQFIQPEYFSDGLIENTKLLTNEVNRWYSEILKAPSGVTSALVEEFLNV